MSSQLSLNGSELDNQPKAKTSNAIQSNDLSKSSSLITNEVILISTVSIFYLILLFFKKKSFLLNLKDFYNNNRKMSVGVFSVLLFIILGLIGVIIVFEFRKNSTNSGKCLY